MRAAIGVYRVDSRCQAEYLGSVRLNKPSVAVGLSVDRPSLLVFAFASSSWLGNSHSAISYETLLTPRSGYDYDVGVRYADDLYEVSIWEKDRRSGARREVERRDLAARSRPQ